MKLLFFPQQAKIRSLTLILCAILMVVTSSVKAQNECYNLIWNTTLSLVSVDQHQIVIQPRFPIWSGSMFGCGYRVYYRNVDYPELEGSIPYDPGPGESVTISGLSSGALYHIEFQQVDSFGVFSYLLNELDVLTRPGGSCLLGDDAGVYVNANDRAGVVNLGELPWPIFTVTRIDDIRGHDQDWYYVTSPTGELYGSITGPAVTDYSNNHRPHIAGVYVSDPRNVHNQLAQVWQEPGHPQSFGIDYEGGQRGYYVFVKNGSPCYSSPYTLTLSAISTGAAAGGDIPIQNSCPFTIAGNCNGDASINAGDISAVILELFDGDGDNIDNSAGGSHIGYCGCDANRDGIIDAADITCVVLTIFNQPCGGSTSLKATTQMIELLRSEFAEKGRTPTEADLNNIVDELTHFIESNNFDDNSDIEHEVKVFPNPTVGSIFISGVSEGAEVELFDLSGRLLQVRSFSNENLIKIDANDVPSGYYYLKIKNAQTGELTTHPVSIVK